MKKTLLLTAIWMLTPVLAAPKVLSSIYPLQQIANAIVGEPTALLADSYLSPHQYTITPANTEQLRDADIVVWVGEAMMPQLTPYIKQRQAAKRTTITASRLPDITLLTAQAAHAHHNHHKHHTAADAHDDKSDNTALTYDPHLWLSTDNAKAIGKAITDALSRLDPANQALYADNLTQFINALAQTQQQIRQGFDTHPPPPYFIFHDAYHYFEHEFGIDHAGVIRAHAGQTPRTRHLSQLQQQLAATPNACLFREPQFQSLLVEKLAAQSGATIAVLDPLGYRRDNDAGQAGYPAILLALARQLQQCGQ